MNLNRLAFSAFVAAVVGLAAVVVHTSQTPPAVKEIALKAEKYKFTPNKIDVPLNTTVRFAITADDRDHGFEIEGVKDSCVKIPKGETKIVEYKATKAGEFKFKCCDFCGLGHGGMKGAFIVK